MKKYNLLVFYIALIYFIAGIATIILHKNYTIVSEIIEALCGISFICLVLIKFKK